MNLKKYSKELIAIGFTAVLIICAMFAGCSRNGGDTSVPTDVSGNEVTPAATGDGVTDEIIDSLPVVPYDYRVYGAMDEENDHIYTNDYFGFRYELNPDLGLDVWTGADLAMLSGLTDYDTEQLAAVINFQGIGTVYYADTMDGNVSLKCSIVRNNGSDARTLLNWFASQDYLQQKYAWYGVVNYETNSSALDVKRYEKEGTFPVAVNITTGTAGSMDDAPYNETIIAFPTQNYVLFLEITCINDDITTDLLSGLTIVAESIPTEVLTVSGELPGLSNGEENLDTMGNPYTAIGDYNAATTPLADKFDELCARYGIIPTKSQTGDDLEWYGSNDSVSFTYAKCVQQITLSDYLSYFYAMFGSSPEQPLCEMYLDQTEIARYAIINDGTDEFILIGAKNLDEFKAIVEEFGLSFTYDEAVAEENRVKNEQLYESLNDVAGTHIEY